MCFFEGGYFSQGSVKEALQSCVNVQAQEQWTEVAEGQDKLFTKEVT